MSTYSLKKCKKLALLRRLSLKVKADTGCCGQDLTDSMMAHLRLSFNNEQASDERVRAAPVPALHV